MKRGLLYSVVILLLVVGLSLTQKNNPAKGSAQDKVSLGVKIGIIPTGGLTQYALVFHKGQRLHSIREVNLHRLIKLRTRQWPIPRTTTFHDFFEEHGMYNDNLYDGTVIDYGADFDSLSKVRFKSHPVDHH